MNLFHKSSASILFCIRASPCNLNPLKTFTLSQHRCGSHVHANNPFVKVSEEVREAVESRKPVVALETTIYTHGGWIFI